MAIDLYRWSMKLTPIKCIKVQHPSIRCSLQVNQLIYAGRWGPKIELGQTMDFIYSLIDVRSNLVVFCGRHIVCLIVLSKQVMYEVWQLWVSN